MFGAHDRSSLISRVVSVELGPDTFHLCTLRGQTWCNVVQFAPGYVCVSECDSNSVKMTRSNSVKVTWSNSTRSSNDRSDGAMDEEDIETAKSEFRLGIECILRRGFIYS